MRDAAVEPPLVAEEEIDFAASATTDAHATTSRILLVSRKDSLETRSNLPPKPTFGARQANNANEPPMTITRKASMNTPRAGSVAKAWTDVMTPERTRKVPSRDRENARIARITVQLLKLPRFSVTANECINAVPTSQGMNDAFSTGSQNHQPPQPSSLYAHQLPSMMPIVRNAQAAVVQGLDQRAHAASSWPLRSAAMAKANATENPT